jgi:hypothetical protein
VRELYGLSISPAQMAAFRSVVATLRVTRPVAPPILRRGWNTRTFDEVARTERRRRRRAPAAS